MLVTKSLFVKSLVSWYRLWRVQGLLPGVCTCVTSFEKGRGRRNRTVSSGSGFVSCCGYTGARSHNLGKENTLLDIDKVKDNKFKTIKKGFKKKNNPRTSLALSEVIGSYKLYNHEACRFVSMLSMINYCFKL